MKSSFLIKFILPILLVCLYCPFSQAHKIRIFAWEEDGIIKTETQFSGGRVAKNAAITVNNGNNKELLSGATDDQGIFNFTIPQAAKENRFDLNIVVNSGDGHKNSWHLSAADYLQGKDLPPPQKTTNERNSPVCVVDEEQLTRIIQSTLEKQLAPVKRSLAEQQDKKPSIQDILGGLGYIIGLAGITAYFKSKNINS